MPISLPEFDTVEKKELEDTHELLKLQQRESGVMAIFLTAKGTESGAVFGGHNWEEIGQHPAIIEGYFRQIGSRAEFITISEKIRDNMQGLIEEGKI